VAIRGVPDLGEPATALYRSNTEERAMEQNETNGNESQSGRVGWIVLWLLGIPIPVLLILFLMRGCT